MGKNPNTGSVGKLKLRGAPQNVLPLLCLLATSVLANLDLKASRLFQFTHLF
jgi:hypothetical protein